MFAHLAEAAVHHERVKQGNYDALLYFFGGLDNAADVQRSSTVHGGFFDTALRLSNMIFAVATREHVDPQ